MALKGKKEEFSEEEKSLWNLIQERYEEGKAARPDGDWTKWINLYNFKHWNEKRPAYKASLTTNFCFSNVETILPIMTDNPPRVFILPQSDEDIRYAQAMEKVLEYVWTTVCDMDLTVVDVLKTALILGTSFIKVHWDKNKNKIGDIDVIPLKPESVVVDPLATKVEDANFIIVSEIKTLSEIRELYPEEGHRVTADEEYSGDRECVMVMECWFKDNALEDTEESIDLPTGRKLKVSAKKKKYPRGRVVVAANKVILRDEANPYKDGKFPFVRFIDHTRPDSFWGRGEIEIIESLQMEHNKRTSQVIDSMNLTSNPIWIIDRQAGVDTDNLVNRPGLIVEKNVGSEVRREQPPSIPPYVIDSIHRTEANIETISGIHDVTQGRQPTGITAASSILELQEAAQTKIRLKTRLFEASLRDLGKLLISRIQQFYTGSRLISLLSADEQPEVFQFNASMELTDVQTNKPRQPFKQNFDIKIASGSTLPVSKTARFQQAVQLYQMDCIDQEAFLEAAEYPNRRAIIKRMNDAKQAQMAASLGAQQPSSPIPGGLMPTSPAGEVPPGAIPQGEEAILPTGEGTPAEETEEEVD